MLVFLFSWGLGQVWLMVISAGIAGGVVSTQQRVIVNYATDVKWVRGFINPAPYINAILSAMFGGISAVILFCILQSQILPTLGFQWDWVPSFKYAEQEFQTVCKANADSKDSEKTNDKQPGDPNTCMNITRISTVLLNNPPKNAKSMALLFLFSFLAGFSERLVTDLLDKITVKISGKQQST